MIYTQEQTRRMHEMMGILEWCALGVRAKCPMCGNDSFRGHKEDCALGNLLNELKG